MSTFINVVAIVGVSALVGAVMSQLYTPGVKISGETKARITNPG